MRSGGRIRRVVVTSVLAVFLVASTFLTVGCSQIAVFLYEEAMEDSDDFVPFVDIRASRGDDGTITVDLSGITTGPTVPERNSSRRRYEVHAGYEVYLSRTSPVDNLRKALTVYDNRENSGRIPYIEDRLPGYDSPPGEDATVIRYEGRLSPRRVTLEEDHLVAGNASTATRVYVVVRSIMVHQDEAVWDWYYGSTYPENPPKSDMTPSRVVTGLGKSGPVELETP